MDNRTWNEFELRIPVRADVATLYNAWATTEGIERWFLRSARFTTPEGRTREVSEQVRKGDRYEWLWHGYSDDVMESNSILEANGEDFIQFEFTGQCVVSVRLIRGGEDTTVVLKQEGIPEDDDPLTNL